jgi:hypothetical protein
MSKFDLRQPQIFKILGKKSSKQFHIHTYDVFLPKDGPGSFTSPRQIEDPPWMFKPQFSRPIPDPKGHASSYLIL